MASLSGLTFDIYRGSSHDGPGLRTVVFFKGCPLRCQWCHNPAGLASQPELMWQHQKCIQCGACQKACQTGSITIDQGVVSIDRDNCTRCFDCAKACPSKALSVVGQAWTVTDLVREVMKDQKYFEAFGGGVTVSGGEPALQSAFIKEFFTRLKENKISTALDTSGYAPAAVFEHLLPVTDIILYDLKLVDPALHQQHAGVDNTLILENFKWIADYARRHDQPLWVRTPLIPGATATPDNLAAIGQWIKDHAGDRIDRWELCCFNNTCEEKYTQLAMQWAYAGVPLLRDDFVQDLRMIANRFVPDEKIVVSGLTGRT
jgi:pyruvate formate lyase activating enzyme